MGLEKALHCGVALTFRQQNIVRPFEHMFADCNLYLVTRRPRTYVLPNTVRIRRSGRLTGKFAIDIGGVNRKHRFEFPLRLPDDDKLTWARNLPRDYYQITDRSGSAVFHGDPWGLLLLSTGFAPALAEHEVVYVGHSVGNKHERNSLDRVTRHETIQQIYADHFGQDYDIFISMVYIDGSTSMFQLSTTTDFTMSSPHVSELTSRAFRNDRSIYAESVRIAEAALISYFKPEYNTNHKHNFPHKPTKISELLTRYNYTNLTITLDSSDTGITLWSPARNPRYFHHLTFRLTGPRDIPHEDFAKSAQQIEDFIAASLAASSDDLNRLSTVTLACVPTERPNRIR